MYGEKMEMSPMKETDTLVELPNTLRNWFEAPDQWSRNQESLEMRNEWLSAERDDVVQYVKMLKKLALYLARNSRGMKGKALRTFFTKAEQDFPNYLRIEMAIEQSE
jgi:hypothetical protein